MVPVFAEMRGADGSDLILCLHVVDEDFAFLNKPLDTKVLQSDAFYLRAVGPVASDVKSRRIVDIHRYAVEKRAKSQLIHQVREKH